MTPPASSGRERKILGRPVVNQRRGLDTRANRTEWARLVSPSPKPAETGMAQGRSEKIMVIRPSRESATGWTRGRKAVRAPSHLLLNEPGLALNVFWLPAGREEGVRCERTKVRVRQTDLSPRPDAPRWNQMGD